MNELESLRRELDRLRAAIPKQDPWPPKDSFGRCIYDFIGRPSKKVNIFEMLESAAKIVWKDIKF
jgi:hypothetical protein